MGVVGEPQRKRTLPYGRQTIDDEDVEAVAQQLRSPWLTQGPTVDAFEKALAERTGARHAVAVSSGTAALHLAALAAGIGPGDFGITSAITFVASANCFRYVGARPLLADVEPESGLARAESIALEADAARQAGMAVRAIVGVDLAGQPADLVALEAVARERDLVLIEDAAHALGARYRSEDGDVSAGSCRHTDLAVFSFHPVKHITTGEGGAVLTNDEALADRIRELRHHGITKDPGRLSRRDGPWYHEVQDLGYNYRLTDFQCALGLSQLKKLNGFLERRERIAALYDDALATEPLSDYFCPLTVDEGKRSAYHLYVVRLRRRAKERLDHLNDRRKRIFEGMAERGIQCQVHYIPLHFHPALNELGALTYSKAGLSGAEEYYAGCLSLPMYPALSEEDVARVVSALEDCVR